MSEENETNQPNEEAKRRGIKIGSRIRDMDTDTGIVVGFDVEGNPQIRYDTLFGKATFDPRGQPQFYHSTTDSDLVEVILIDAPHTDQKPRGEKAPLSLLPWDVLAACRLAPPFLQKLHDDIGLLPIDRPRLASIPKERTTDFLSELVEPEAPALGVDLGDVARVFAYGETKYAPDNWRTFQWDAASDREYWSAFLRHLLADSRGEKNDPESGLPHLAHAVCCLLIVAYHEAK